MIRISSLGDGHLSLSLFLYYFTIYHNVSTGDLYNTVSRG